MNFLNLLTKEKNVVGIEISDSVVRIAFFRPKKETSGIKLKKDAAAETSLKDELILIEEPISADIIADGVVVNGELLGKTLKNIWAKANLGTNYAIVAIPDDKIYSRIFSFPKSISETRLTEAMRLAISFQLPMNTKELYLDWETLKGTTTANEIYLSTIPRTVADGYVQALEKAGIKTLALESHLSSIARAVKLTPGETVIFSKKTPDGDTIFALQDGVMRFSRTLPRVYIPEVQVRDEIAKVEISLGTETKSTVVVKDLSKAEIRDDYASRPEYTEPKSKWIIALGAALRGKIPEGQDNLVSLLPIGTEEAYAYQRATTFIALIRNLIVGISIFFVVAYLATYLFMLSLVANTSSQITTLSAVATPPEIEQKQQQINDINTLTATGATLLSQTPTWSAVLTEVLSRTPDGITISAFGAPSFTENITITGIAASRAVLNNYEKVLRESTMFAEVILPLNNLEQKDMIPFTVSFRLADPAALYYK